jgi:signal transduction histidine kinase/CheY-like chemotaxis protein
MRRSAVRASTMVAGISLLLLCLAIAGALVVGRSTAKSIEALRRSAESLGRGEPVTATLSGIVEMDAVSTAMVQAGDEIRSGKAELERRVEEAVAVAERSQRALLRGQKLEALGRLTGGIAHDFNNVLQTLTTGLDMARVRSDDPRVTSALEACQRAVQRATELTSQLMVFGRVQDARLETVDLPAQIAAMTPLLKGALRSDIQLRLDIADKLWPVTMDPLQFELVVLNLTINARDAMPRGGCLQIEVRNETVNEPLSEIAPGDYVRLCITDTGEGMTQEVLAQAFDPFFTTKGIGKGSGLGLPQAYGFAKQSGGALILHSKPGEGTAAALYLPKSDRPVSQAQPGSSVVQKTAASGALVLFVEDDPLVREVVAPALEASGFKVTVANNGEQALALLEAKERIDLVFSDIIMPGRVNGIDLADIIQARFPRVRVVLATGYTDRRVQTPGIRILAKPYEVAQIVEALQQELQVQASRENS